MDESSSLPGRDVMLVFDESWNPTTEHHPSVLVLLINGANRRTV